MGYSRCYGRKHGGGANVPHHLLSVFETDWKPGRESPITGLISPLYVHSHAFAGF